MNRRALYTAGPWHGALNLERTPIASAMALLELQAADVSTSVHPNACNASMERLKSRLAAPSSRDAFRGMATIIEPDQKLRGAVDLVVVAAVRESKKL